MPRQPHLPDRRERIVEAADQLFSHYGYEKTTMEDISRHTAIPRATIYLEFPGGKEDILMASIERYLTRLLDSMRQVARQSRSSRLEALRQVILFYLLSAYDKATHQCDLNNIDRYSKRIRQEMTELFKRRNAFFTELLQQAVLAGELPETYDLDHAAELVAHGLTSFMPSAIGDIPRPVLERDAGAFFGLLLSGLAKSRNHVLAVSAL